MQAVDVQLLLGLRAGHASGFRAKHSDRISMASSHQSPRKDRPGLGVSVQFPPNRIIADLGNLKSIDHGAHLHCLSPAFELGKYHLHQLHRETVALEPICKVSIRQRGPTMLALVLII